MNKALHRIKNIIMNIKNPLRKKPSSTQSLVLLYVFHISAGTRKVGTHWSFRKEPLPDRGKEYIDNKR